MKKHQDKSRTGLNRVEDQTTPTQENTRGESHASSWFDGHGVYLWKTPGVATAGEEHRPGTDSMSRHLTVPLIWWWEEQKSLESLFATCAPNPILSLGDGNKAESKRHPKSEREREGERERDRDFRCARAHPAEGRGWGGRSPDSKYATAIKATLDAVVRAKKNAPKLETSCA